jgi:hypothetical protein
MKAAAADLTGVNVPRKQQSRLEFPDHAPRASIARNLTWPIS